ncbi:hypothetical protein Ciccas_002908 [Cichlidogyrus casuarinus]|uniref:Zinc finger protein 830 n=1 Tax=Cichlidogyrus casuarinus TaxID=1844966 RepID=A0ABD2QFX3_9PLAT
MQAKKKIDEKSKLDVRTLIKATKETNKRINHPNAKYNSLGKITCTVCGIQIKSEIAWKPHILSRTHLAVGVHNLNKQSNVSTVDNVKKVVDSINTIDPVIEEVPVQSEASTKTEKKEIVPEGFFDDPHKDAQVRKVPFKDKITEELEMFKKEMISLDKEFIEMTEKDEENTVTERKIEEIEVQISKWQKLNELEKRKEEITSRVAGSKRTKMDKDPRENKHESSSSDEDFTEMTNFRRKAFRY